MFHHLSMVFKPLSGLASASFSNLISYPLPLSHPQKLCAYNSMNNSGSFEPTAFVPAAPSTWNTLSSLSLLKFISFLKTSSGFTYLTPLTGAIPTGSRIHWAHYVEGGLINDIPQRLGPSIAQRRAWHRDGPRRCLPIGSQLYNSSLSQLVSGTRLWFSELPPYVNTHLNISFTFILLRKSLKLRGDR